MIDPEPNDQLVFLGDYLDRGNNSKEVVDYLIELGGQYSCSFIMGNHELMLLDHLKGHRSKEWRANGGEGHLKILSKKSFRTLLSQGAQGFL